MCSCGQVMNIICIEFFVFTINSISSNKHIFEISQVDSTYTWSNQFVFIT